MAFRIDWTETALSDLLETVRYIAEDNPEAARRFGNLIVDRIETIARFPFSAPLASDEDDTVLCVADKVQPAKAI